MATRTISLDTNSLRVWESIPDQKRSKWVQNMLEMVGKVKFFSSKNPDWIGRTVSLQDVNEGTYEIKILVKKGKDSYKLYIYRNGGYSFQAPADRKMAYNYHSHMTEKREFK
ncbi:MAG: hypothetical protein K9L56_15510 [Clostridiales bacterium]|nr:hypothetical protein [Clostridiales bacterium]